MTRLTFSASDRPSPEDLADLLDAAGLRRPTTDLSRLNRMMDGSNVLLTCWDEEADPWRLVGFLRGWTDGAFNGFIADLAVHPDLQHRGIGRDLLARCRAIGAPDVRWVLIAAEGVGGYYASLGWEPLMDGWNVPRASFASRMDPPGAP